MAELMTVRTMPIMLKVRPAIAIPRLVDFMPFSDITSPIMVIGKPKSGMIHANNPTMPRTSPAVALPVGLSAGSGMAVFSAIAGCV
jgi:hypothetical protein